GGGGWGGAGMARSGSERSGSSPRVALSNVARDTPDFCASGHSDWMKAVKAAAGAARAGAPAASATDRATTTMDANLAMARIMCLSMRRSRMGAQVALRRGARRRWQRAVARDNEEARIGRGVADLHQRRIDVG